MSTRTDYLRRRDGSDEGFTLIEVIVALSIFAVVAIAALPLLLVGLKAGQKARVETLAKDMSQLRIERLRNLPFQVDRQNGPFVDLLDRYFTHANAAAAPIATDEANCTGVYLSAAPGTGGAPSGPAFRVTCTSLPEAQGFSQQIYVQFLLRTGVPVTPPAGYNSQQVGADTAPSRLVGVTVLTSWNRSGQNGTLRTFTEVADARSNRPLITTQAQAIALRVTSNDAAAQTGLVAQAGEVKADGSLTSGSVASVQARGALLEQLGLDPVSSSLQTASAPTNPAGSSAEVGGARIAAGESSSLTDWAACGWGFFGKSAYGNVSATTATGIPVVPSNNTPDVTASGSTTSQAGLLNQGGGCQSNLNSESYAFGYRNWLTTPAYNSMLGLSSGRPLVYMLDPNAGGGLSTGRLLGEASVSGTDILTAPHTASARAGARVDTVHMLPTTAFPAGLVKAKLTSSSLTCKSDGTVAGAYSLDVAWPGGSKTITSPSSTAPSLPDPTTITWTDGGITRKLSDYLSWSVSAGVTETNTGARSIDHVFRLTSPDSVVGPGGLAVQLGALSCTAADNR